MIVMILTMAHKLNTILSVGTNRSNTSKIHQWLSTLIIKKALRFIFPSSDNLNSGSKVEKKNDRIQCDLCHISQSGPFLNKRETRNQ